MKTGLFNALPLGGTELIPNMITRDYRVLFHSIHINNPFNQFPNGGTHTKFPKYMLKSYLENIFLFQ